MNKKTINGYCNSMALTSEKQKLRTLNYKSHRFRNSISLILSFSGVAQTQANILIKQYELIDISWC